MGTTCRASPPCRPRCPPTDSKNLVFFAFDLLFEGREDLRGLPLGRAQGAAREAARELRRVSTSASCATWNRAATPCSSPRARWGSRASCRSGSMRRTHRGAATAGARRNAARATRSCWAAGPSEAGDAASLLAGVNRDGHLVYVGRIGTGYTRKTAEELLPKLKALTVETESFRRRERAARRKATCDGSSRSSWPRSNSPAGPGRA